MLHNIESSKEKCAQLDCITTVVEVELKDDEVIREGQGGMKRKLLYLFILVSDNI